ncbi:phosphohistidine phosphatase SixA [Thalassotalea litorea]|uniref:Phosphohistidine phosphatase SixA n=1 Tax=Thalassotalea litorea TaxID=2020715 RepID=A0A5R9IX16_9GAMM|nr:phosphohistidine phosphatase SixA [Thalassotalea litorea]TLU67726.1 phosphohistidine phosphatase SixA [Thalassotalea litorea]
MNIFIMRHGEAELQSDSDMSRQLTQLGALETQVMARWLEKKQVSLDAILVSPYTRTQQTAALMNERFGGTLAVQTLSLFTPSGSASDCHDYLDGTLNLERWKNILIVSHMPLVSYLTAQLSIEKSTPVFVTAAIAHIDYDMEQMTGHYQGIYTPDDFC